MNDLITRCGAGLAIFVLVAACKTAEPPNIRGGQQWINLPPQNAERPIVGSYGFDLLGPVEAEACVGKKDPKYYVTMGPRRIGSMFSSVSGTQAEAAAVYQALKGLKDADLILVTRAVTQLKGGKECAQIRGRALRLKKADQQELKALEDEDEASQLPVAKSDPLDEPEDAIVKPAKKKKKRKKSRRNKRRKNKK